MGQFHRGHAQYRKPHRAWWYKRTAPAGDNTCHDVLALTTSDSLSGLTAGSTYTYKAYGKSGCYDADEIASHTFTLGALGASNVIATKATHTLPGHTGDWYYQANAKPHDSCSAAQTKTTIRITGLNPNTSYVYTAYSARPAPLPSRPRPRSSR